MPAATNQAPAAPHDVLVVKPSSLGDVIHTLPAVHALKTRWPETRIHWVVNEEWAPLLDGNPDVHAVITFPRRRLRGIGAISGFLRWAAAARATVSDGFDLAIDFQGLLRSALIAKACRARKLLGLDDAREGAGWFYHQRAAVRQIPHAVDRYLALASLAGADTRHPVFPLPAGSPPTGLRPDSLTGAVVLHPFSRGSGKSLPVGMVEETISLLAPRTVVLMGVGGPAGHVWPANTLDLVNRTSLAELVWVMRHAAAVISVDSGPMHLAAALPIPLLGLHTWSDPRKVGPWRPDASVWKSGTIVRVADLNGQADAWCRAPSGWTTGLPTGIADWLDRDPRHQAAGTG